MLDNEHSAEQIAPVLPAQRQGKVCRASLSLRVHEGKAAEGYGEGGGGISEEYHLLYLFFAQVGKNP